MTQTTFPEHFGITAFSCVQDDRNSSLPLQVKFLNETKEEFGSDGESSSEKFTANSYPRSRHITSVEFMSHAWTHVGNHEPLLNAITYPSCASGCSFKPKTKSGDIRSIQKQFPYKGDFPFRFFCRVRDVNFFLSSEFPCGMK